MNAQIAANTAARSLLDEFFGDFARPASTRSFTPAVDIAETETGYLLRADLPGVPREEVKVEIKDSILTLRGTRKAPELDPRKWRYSEVGYGEFVRRFTLPDTVDGDKVEASFDNGVLEIRLGRKAELGPRVVEIR